MRADRVFFNGKVHAGEPACAPAQAIATAARRILAVGRDAEVRPLLRAGGEAVDLRGRTVLPGLIDAHVHMGWYSLALHAGRLDLDGLPSRADVLARVAQAARGRPHGNWILGAGWNRNAWADPSFPSAADLDAVAPEHPVALQDKSRHATWANRRALEAAGITPETPDPPGGQVVRDAAGRPTGMLLETAADLVTAAIPRPDLPTMVTALQAGIADAQRLGLTGFHDPGDPAVLAALQILHAQGELGARALVHIPADGLASAEGLGLRSGLGDEMLRIGGLKIFADGALGPRTAHLLAPYAGTRDECGIPTHGASDLGALVRRAHRAGLSVAIHAIGDAANRAALDAIQAARPEGRDESEGAARPSCPSLPDRLEHVQLLDPEDLPRLAQLGVVASMQPIHATSDMEMAERHWGRRCDHAYAWRGVLESGARLAFGSDCPIESLDPLAGIHAAVTRRRADGSPGPQGWIPGQRLSVAEAVHAYTAGAAHASGELHLKGTLSPGKLADLVVLSRDIFQVDPDEILEARVEMTVLGGTVVFRDEE